ncbi:MAG: hypothetical protein P8X63_11980 [Desulfuromonadaceae bacterium]
MKSIRILIAVPLLVALLTGCSTSFTNLQTTPPEHYETLGPVTGKASGSLGILGTAYYFIPMGLNSRIERAYQNALEQAPGATELINVTYSESWFWWIIGTGRTVTITGEAIRGIEQ